MHGEYIRISAIFARRFAYWYNNAARNNPYKESHHPRYEYLEKVDDSALKSVGAKLFPEGAKFLRVEEDATIGDKPMPGRAER